MKTNLIHYRIIVLLVAIVALSTGQTQAQVDAQTEQTRQVTIVQDMAPVGLAYGQSLIINVVNPLEPAAPGEDGRKLKMLFAVTVLLADGRVAAQSDEIALDPGQFHSFAFKRADLPLAREERIGRLQVRARVIWKKLQLKTEFPSSVELVDDGTGKTTVLISQKPKEIVVVGSK